MNAFLPTSSGAFDWMPLWVSLRVGVTATAIGMVVGTLLGNALAQGRLPGRKILESAVLLPLVLSPTVLGFFFLVVVGRRRPVGQAWKAVFGSPLVFTFQAAVPAASVATIPLVPRTLSAAFASVSREVLEAARLDGAGGLGLLWHVHLPLIRPHLPAAATNAFARALVLVGAMSNRVVARAGCRIAPPPAAGVTDRGFFKKSAFFPSAGLETGDFGHPK